MTSGMLTLPEAARVLGVRTATLRAQIARGRLSAVRRGRDWHVLAADLERYRDEVQHRHPSRSSVLDAVLRGIAGEFEATAAWPHTAALQRRLIQDCVEVDLSQLARSLDPSLGRIERGGVASLTIRGLLRAGASESVVDFEVAMRLAIVRYRDPSVGDPTIADEDFRRLGMSAPRLERLTALLNSNPLIIGGGSATGTSWTYRVSDDVHLLGRTQTVQGYLTVLDHLRSSKGLLDVGPTTTGWAELDDRLRAISRLLESAVTVDDHQDIGRRCREAVRVLWGVVGQYVTGRVGPQVGNPKEELLAFLDATAQGPSFDDLRGLVRSAYALANHVTHGDRGERSEAVAAAQATALLVRTFRELVLGDLEHGGPRS